MASVKLNFDRTKARADVDWDKVRATTEADIQRHMVEDGEEPDDPSLLASATQTPAQIRARAGITQAEMARRLRVPLTTWRNWEQGRVALDPAVRTMLDLVADDPDRAFKVLGTSAE